ncbi:MAG: hypothetical protein K6F58_00800 [Bacteroidales bacterium]|nr:hypothetical protein [Bacteroidales bacterium]
MRRFILSLALLALSVPGWSQAAKWPDGSVIDQWLLKDIEGVQGQQAKRFVITRYGAVRDSSKVQTEAVQKAIDAAAVKGGTVVIPKGVWLSGALFFKPGTHLLLEEDAVLKGSTDLADYPDIPVHIEGVLQPYVSALVNASGCDGFTIDGDGSLDGNGQPFWEAFWATRKANPACTNLEVRRPRLIGISGSRDVSISGVTLRNSAFWNIHLYKCARVKIKRVDIYAPIKPVKAPSSDGIDIDACSDVLIKHCSIACGDDHISLKGGKGPWADNDPDNGPDERILIDKCNFGHGPGALVLGSECVKAENIILRDSKVDGTERVLWLKMRPDTPQHYSHIMLQNVEGKAKYGIYVKPWTQFFDLKGREDIPRSYASDIVFRYCNLKLRQAKRIVEMPDQYEVSGLVFKGNKFRYIYNSDESNVSPYELPDPLSFADGMPVASPEQWPARRKEILSLFEREMYGQMPPAQPFSTEVLEEGPALDGTAVRRLVRMNFADGALCPHIDWMVLYPSGATGPLPAVLMMNYYGNGKVLDKASDNSVTVFPFRELFSRGYAFATACYEEVYPDPEEADKQAGLSCALMKWAWGLCRGLDMLEGDPRIDASKVVVTGCSRLGKAALLAGAFDERFAAVVVNQTGGGGVPLAKRNFGEYVGSQVEMFPHWWCPEFSKYAASEWKLPFDQHMLLACIAPRPLLVEGFNNPWFDTRGEFLALQAASPVWRFLGGSGLPEVPWPADLDTSAIGRDLGYVRRSGGHGIAAEDWRWLLDFADAAIGK